MSETAERYEGQPLLRLLDSYVLDAIGLLDERTSASLVENAPRIAASMKIEPGTWQQVVERAVGMPDDGADQIRTSYDAYVTHVRGLGEEPDPLGFAWAFNDAQLGQ